MMHTKTALSSFGWIGFSWLIGLVSLQSIPHTGALRTLFLLFGIVHVGIAFHASSKTKGALSWPRMSAEGVLFMLLSCWLILQSSFLVDAPTVALSALANEWGRLMLMAGLGMAAATIFGRRDSPTLVAAVFAGCFVHVLFTLAQQVFSIVRGGGLIFRDDLMVNYSYVSPFTTAAFALLLADGMSRFRYGKQLLPLSFALWVTAVLATLAAEALLQAKAGQVMCLFLALVCLPLFPRSSKFSRRRVILGGTVFLLLLATAGLTTGNRWRGMTESIRIAVAQQNDIQWLNTPHASQISGSDGSFYERATWGKIGLAGISKHPLGLGYGKDAFGRYVNERYGIPGLISSHSGWIDFALANGIPGLVLLLVLSFALILRGWRAFQAGDPVGLALALITFHYIVRCALDGILTGSRLTGSCFVIGLLWALTMLNKNRRASHAA